MYFNISLTSNGMLQLEENIKLQIDMLIIASLFIYDVVEKKRTKRNSMHVIIFYYTMYNTVFLYFILNVDTVNNLTYDLARKKLS